MFAHEWSAPRTLFPIEIIALLTPKAHYPTLMIERTLAWQSHHGDAVTAHVLWWESIARTE
eukprot:6207592-Amphidinium_carterae.2